MNSERSLFLGGLLVGLVTALPAGAFAAGQWCNDTYVQHRAPLTLVSATVSGKNVTPLPSASYDVTSSPNDPTFVNAHLFCPGCPDQAAPRDNLVRQP
jgi:hypothetical protein